MIDAKELRIGNWVRRQDDINTIINISANDNDGYAVKMRGNLLWVALEKLEPIPLTTEIVLKCGGEHSMGGHYHLEEKFRISFYNDDRLILVFYNREVRVDIKYVHQFQNLIYALTQKELEIKL